MLGIKREENDSKAFPNQKGGTMKNVLPIKMENRQNRKLTRKLYNLLWQTQ